eukprot:111813_1
MKSSPPSYNPAFNTDSQRAQPNQQASSYQHPVATVVYQQPSGQGYQQPSGQGYQQPAVTQGYQQSSGGQGYQQPSGQGYQPLGGGPAVNPSAYPGQQQQNSGQIIINNMCKKCGQLYNLPPGASSWRCQKCREYNDHNGGMYRVCLCTIL